LWVAEAAEEPAKMMFFGHIGSVAEPVRLRRISFSGWNPAPLCGGVVGMVVAYIVIDVRIVEWRALGGVQMYVNASI
jgi:hypothetical protein